MSYINVTLAFLNVAAVVIAVCAWYTPVFLRRTACKLLARAYVRELEQSNRQREREYYIEQRDFHEREFGCARTQRKEQPENVPAIVRWGREK